MSDTDSFIEEVTEEVRRDRLFALMKRYGWIAIALVLLLVAGTGWNEWKKAQENADAQALGDSILTAFETEDGPARADALSAIEAPTPASGAVLAMLVANANAESDPAAAAAKLLALADDADAPAVYRRIATLKAVMLPEAGLSVDDRRMRLDALAGAGGLLGLLAEEQLAYLDMEIGETEPALERLSKIVENSQATAGLRQRAAQVIVALGAEPPLLPQGVE